VQMVHLGSDSHGAALRAMVPGLLDLLDGPVPVRFTYFGRRAVDPQLEAHPNARRMEPMRWPDYQRWLGRQRFHLGLYPLLACRFDRARSDARLAQHGAVGALGVYPQDWAPAQALGAGALLAPANPENWGEFLREALAGRAGWAARVDHARQYLACQNRDIVQQLLWNGVLAPA